MRRCSEKANNLRYINTIRVTPRDIAIKEREITIISKPKSSRLSYIFVQKLYHYKYISSNLRILLRYQKHLLCSAEVQRDIFYQGLKEIPLLLTNFPLDSDVTPST